MAHRRQHLHPGEEGLLSRPTPFSAATGPFRETDSPSCVDVNPGGATAPTCRGDMPLWLPPSRRGPPDRSGWPPPARILRSPTAGTAPIEHARMQPQSHHIQLHRRRVILQEAPRLTAAARDSRMVPPAFARSERAATSAAPERPCVPSRPVAKRADADAVYERGAAQEAPGRRAIKGRRKVLTSTTRPSDVVDVRGSGPNTEDEATTASGRAAFRASTAVGVSGNEARPRAAAAAAAGASTAAVGRHIEEADAPASKAKGGTDAVPLSSDAGAAPSKNAAAAPQEAEAEQPQDADLASPLRAAAEEARKEPAFDSDRGRTAARNPPGEAQGVGFSNEEAEARATTSAETAAPTSETLTRVPFENTSPDRSACAGAVSSSQAKSDSTAKRLSKVKEASTAVALASAKTRTVVVSKALPTASATDKPEQGQARARGQKVSGTESARAASKQRFATTATETTQPASESATCCRRGGWDDHQAAGHATASSSRVAGGQAVQGQGLQGGAQAQEGERLLVVCDLSRYKQSAIGMRWRNAEEMEEGIGDRVCGGIGCRTQNKLVETHQALHLLKQQIAALRKERGLPDMDFLHEKLLQCRGEAEAAADKAKRQEEAAAQAAGAARSAAFAAEASRANQDRGSRGLKETADRAAKRADEEVAALKVARIDAAAKKKAAEEAAAATAAAEAGALAIDLTEDRIMRQMLEQQQMLLQQQRVLQQLRTYQMLFNYSENGEAKQALVKCRVCVRCAFKLNYDALRKETHREAKRIRLEQRQQRLQQQLRRLERRSGSQGLHKARTRNESAVSSRRGRGAPVHGEIVRVSSSSSSRSSSRDAAEALVIGSSSDSGTRIVLEPTRAGVSSTLSHRQTKGSTVSEPHSATRRQSPCPKAPLLTMLEAAAANASTAASAAPVEGPQPTAVASTSSGVGAPCSTRCNGVHGSKPPRNTRKLPVGLGRSISRSVSRSISRSTSSCRRGSSGSRNSSRRQPRQNRSNTRANGTCSLPSSPIRSIQQPTGSVRYPQHPTNRNRRGSRIRMIDGKSRSRSRCIPHGNAGRCSTDMFPASISSRYPAARPVRYPEVGSTRFSTADVGIRYPAASRYLLQSGSRYPAGSISRYSAENIRYAEDGYCRNPDTNGKMHPEWRTTSSNRYTQRDDSGRAEHLRRDDKICPTSKRRCHGRFPSGSRPEDLRAGRLIGNAASPDRYRSISRSISPTASYGCPTQEERLDWERLRCPRAAASQQGRIVDASPTATVRATRSDSLRRRTAAAAPEARQSFRDAARTSASVQAAANSVMGDTLDSLSSGEMNQLTKDTEAAAAAVAAAENAAAEEAAAAAAEEEAVVAAAEAEAAAACGNRIYGGNTRHSRYSS